MGSLTIDSNRRIFQKNGHPFFYLGDTVWSAFTNVTIEEWEYYLKKRRQQGFTVLQINILPQWDRCIVEDSLYPFATADGQKFNFSKWNQEYFENAKKMCHMAVEQGFQLALVVLWLNYVPGTWGSRMTDQNVMPEWLVPEYAGKVVMEFDEFEPVYIISGDTDFETPEAIDYYRTVLGIICEKSPQSLKTFHIKRGYDVIPEEFLEKTDFYMFQSGHNQEGQDMAYLLPERLMKKYPAKPMINAEPCYEQMGYSRNIYGRFDTKSVRKAAWSSLLSGACAGVTYGAHGIWNWQKLTNLGSSFLGEGFDLPFLWQDALRFQGAWDYGWICQFLAERKIHELIPKNNLLINTTKEIRVAATPDERYLIYLPFTTRLVLQKDFSGYRIHAFDLDGGRCAQLSYKIREGRTELEMPPFENDTLLFLEQE